MMKITFARRAARFSAVLTVALLLGACTSATAPKFPEDEKEEDDKDPKEGVIVRYTLAD